MKILVPMPHFGTAGGSRVLSALGSAWTSAGHLVDMLVPDSAGPPYFPTTARILYGDASGHVTATTPPRSDIMRSGLRNNLILRAGLARIGRDYDVVLSNHNLTAWMSVLARVPRRARFYYIQAYEPDFCLDPFAPGRYVLARMSYRLPLTQIVNASSYRGLGDRPVVPCGIDLATFRPRSRSVDFAANQPILLGTIGRSEPWKGTRYVLEAFERLHALDQRYRLSIAFGNIPDGWSHPAASIVMPDGDAALAAFYRSLDILVAGTYGQNDSPHYPVLEAMASGVPTVNTGYRPADRDNSWLYNARDVNDLVATIASIEHDPQREQKITAGRAAAEQYGWSIVAAQMEQVFLNTLTLGEVKPR